MAANRITGDSLSPNLTGMTKTQLYDIMSQMKTLIEQNQLQAREILVQNPMLTKALFQAQIMLGMVHSPQVIPNIQPPVPKKPQQLITQSAYKSPPETSVQNDPIASQIQNPGRKHQQNQPAISVPSSRPASDLPSRSLPSQPLPTVPHHKGHLTTSLPQSTQISNISLPPFPPLQSVSQPPLPRPQLNPISSNLQQPSQSNNISQLPLQEQFPPQRPLPSLPTLSHQFQPQMSTNMGFQHHGAPPLHDSQSGFHSGNKPQPSIRPLPFAHNQQPHPRQGQAPSMYQMAGLHGGASEFNSQVGNAMAVDRGAGWIGGGQQQQQHVESNTTMGMQQSLMAPRPSHLGVGNNQASGPTAMAPPAPAPAPPAPLSAEMEKALLQQVMSLSSEQINVLPPDQRQQVLQLRQMLSHR